MILSLGLTVCGLAFAAEDSPMACLQNIQQVCAGQDDHLETCLAERGDRLRPTCHDLLSNAVHQSQSDTGVGACVGDVKRFCENLSPTELALCLTENLKHFSSACQKQLEKLNPTN